MAGSIAKDISLGLLICVGLMAVCFIILLAAGLNFSNRVIAVITTLIVLFSVSSILWYVYLHHLDMRDQIHLEVYGF